MKFIMMILNWFKNLFTVTSIPPEIYDETTANEVPDPWSDPDATSMDDYYIPGSIDNQREPSKFAVLIGINKYDPNLNADLNGCVNDVKGMYEILIKRYGFKPDNIRILTDERATGSNIMHRMAWLVDHIVAGDELVLHYSGHGSQIRDRGVEDELEDQLDEILCPHDLDWNNPLTDDDIGNILNTKADGVFFTFICDSCHSGSIDKTIEFSGSNPNKIRYIRPPVDIRMRSIDRELPIIKVGESIGNDHVLLSGCKDNQTSADAYIDDKWQGAMTSSLLQTLSTNPNRNWESVHADIISILNVGGFTQKPQLIGPDSLIQKRNIFGV